MSDSILVEAFRRGESQNGDSFDKVKRALARFQDGGEAEQIEPEIAEALKAICRKLERMQGLYRGLDMSPFVKEVMSHLDLMPAAV